MIAKSLCRICSSTLYKFIDLGMSPISGHFPKIHEETKSLPLTLSRCENCGLIQLYNRMPISELYSETYGYESHLNISMQQHLQNKASNLQALYHKRFGNKNGVFLDIASNDGTLLSGYDNNEGKITLVAIDPLISKFDDYYPNNVIKIEDFFSPGLYKKKLGQNVDIVTSISVFYDLDDPIGFASGVFDILSKGGIWHLEQSYCISMIKQTSFDTICHEHLLYLRAHDFKNIFDKVGFTVISVELNEINGGSISLTVEKSNGHDHCTEFKQLLNNELINGFCDIDVFHEFAMRVEIYKELLRKTIIQYSLSGYKIVGLGASTKGNIILNYSGLNNAIVSAIGEVNFKKFGRVTPGTNIPIVDETSILKSRDKTLAIVLPWHFRETFINKTVDFRRRGNLVLFPLPEIEII